MSQTNDLIETLPPACQAQVLAFARHVELPQHSVLVRTDEPQAYIYLLTSGVASYVVSVEDGGTAEIGMVGPESVIGATSLLGAAPAVSQCVMQVDGAGYRIPFAEVKRLFQESAEIRTLVLRSIQTQWLTLSQIAACNRLHHASERLARWLLTASDRMRSDTISLTQESLSQMLGTRRTTVALIAGSLQRSGFIRYQRGQVRIVDRDGLTEAACDCYTVTRRLIDTLYKDLNARQ